MRKIKLKLVHLLSWFFTKIFSVDDNVFVFESFIGRQYSDNPKAIYEYMIQQYPDFTYYWSIDKNHTDKFNDAHLRTIKKGTFAWFITMAKAKYWISNSRIPLWVVKPKETIYIQTWHGTPLKKLALDMDMTTSKIKEKNYLSQFEKEAARWDHLISPNRYSSDIFKQAFNFKNNLIESGYPRNDFLITNNTEQIKNELKKKMGVPLDKKIIMYAPTWRDSPKFDFDLDLAKMKRTLGDDYFVIVRLHYLVTDYQLDESVTDFYKDMTQYNEMSDLYLVSDCLITDYSSTFFDFSVLQRPIVFYCPDLEEYETVLRGFYFNFKEDAPGPIVDNTDKVIDAILGSGNDQFSAEFFEKFIKLEDGQSTKRVVEQMMKQ